MVVDHTEVGGKPLKSQVNITKPRDIILLALRADVQEHALFWLVFSISVTIFLAVAKFAAAAEMSAAEEGCIGNTIFVMAGGSQVIDCGRDAALQSIGTYDN